MTLYSETSGGPFHGFQSRSSKLSGLGCGQTTKLAATFSLERLALKKMRLCGGLSEFLEVFGSALERWSISKATYTIELLVSVYLGCVAPEYTIVLPLEKRFLFFVGFNF